MNAETFLKSIRRIDNLIDSYQEEADRLYAKLTSTTVHQKEVNVQSSREDTMPENIERLIQLRNKVNDMVDRYVDMKEFAFETIEQIEHIDTRYVIVEYYMHGRNLEDIAEDLDRTRQWICELRVRGLKKFDEIANKSKKYKSLASNCV